MHRRPRSKPLRSQAIIVLVIVFVLVWNQVSPLPGVQLVYALPSELQISDYLKQSISYLRFRICNSECNEDFTESE